jgi:hypothetical protein
MGQFKPMVKMETTEPSVILKLKKGGHVNMKKGGKAEAGHKKMAMGGGAMDMMMGTPALVGRPAVNAPVRAPGKPSMAMRRKAMMAKPAITPSGPPMAAPPMKKGGKAEGGKMDTAQDKAMIKKAFKQHDMQEHKGGKGTDLKLKKGGMKKYASGGAIPSETTSGSYQTTLMHQAKADNSPAKTGDVKMGNAGGFKRGGKAKKMATGGVAKGQGGYATGGAIPSEESYGDYDTTKVYSAKPDRSSTTTGGVSYGNAGGFKAGGKSSKKAYAAGGTVNSGRPVAMPEGRKPVPSPVRISQLAGTYKAGGRATPAESRLLKNNAAENATAMRQAKTQSNMKYGSPKRMADGGRTSGEGAVTDSERKMMDELYFDKNKVNPKSVSDKASRELEEALNPLSMVKELYGKARNAVRGEGSVTDKEREMMEMNFPMRGKGQGAVTKTEKSITVSPAGKKRGGRAC